MKYDTSSIRETNLNLTSYIMPSSLRSEDLKLIIDLVAI